MTKKEHSIRFLDGLIFGIILFVIILSGFFIYGNTSKTLLLHINAPAGEWIYRLDTNRTVAVQGTRGITRIKIENNAVSVIESSCPNKNCIAAKKLEQAGDWNACLPNRVFLHIEGKTKTAEIYIPK